MNETISRLPVEDIYPHPLRYRTLDEKFVKETADRIRTFGYLADKAISVTQDGDIYYIIDGMHRHAAMKMLGESHIPATIEDEELDEKTVTARQIIANKTRPKGEFEDSQGLQQMLKVGNTLSEIAAANDIDAERAERVAKGYKRFRAFAGDDPEQTSLERLEALADFEGDEDASKRIMTAPEASWRNVVAQINADKTIEANRVHAVAIIEAAGCELVAAPDNGTMQYLTSESSIKSDCPAPEGAKWATYNQWNGWIAWYGDICEAVETPEEAAKRAEADRIKAGLDDAAEKRMAFLLAHLTNNGPVTNSNALRDLAIEAWENGASCSVKSIDSALVEVHGPFPRMYAALLSEIERNAAVLLNGAVGYGPMTVAYFDALVAVGYEISAVEDARMAEIRAALAPGDSPDSITEEGDSE